MIELSPYNPLWPLQFEEENKRLQSLFQELPIQFFHIGSTSIENCQAKPIIDILGVTDQIEKIDFFSAELEKSGYKAFGEWGFKRRRFFQKRNGVAINLHIFEDSNPQVARHLRFCHYLRKNQSMRKLYELKKSTLTTNEIYTYTDGKSSLVKEIDYLAACTSDITLPHYPTKIKTWSKELILSCMDANFCTMMSFFPTYVPLLSRDFEFDIETIQSTIPDDEFNYVYSTRFTEENVKERVSAMIKKYKEKNLPFSWEVAPLDTPPALQNTLIEFGMKDPEVSYGMYLSLDSLQVTPQPSDFICRLIETDEEMEDYASIVSLESAHADEILQCYLDLPPLLYQPNSTFQFFVGYYREEPVTTALLVLDAHVAGVYYLNTIEKFRGRGFARATMETLLTHAKNLHYNLSTLQSTEMGKPLYLKMGYQECCQYREYYS